MVRKITTEQFIERAKKMHDDKYDYSKSIYIGKDDMIIIICPQHGEFTQRAGTHVRGGGCKKCATDVIASKRRMTIEQFIERSNNIHNNKYNYEKVVYTNLASKVSIICPVHGEFKQLASSHISGKGCRRCSDEQNAINNRSCTDDFIKKARIKHGDIYDYSKVVYIKNSMNVIIGCPIHGDIEQTPASHLAGHGCIRCAGTYIPNTDEFIKKARAKHGNTYDYSKSEYVNHCTKIIIICAIHGEFKQTPNSHLNGSGCSKCGGNYKMNTDDFIIRAISKHGNKYDYSKTNYIDIFTKVIIICPTHGEFKQTPAGHINKGTGCPKCNGGYKLDISEFIERSKSIHENKYDYSKVVYIKNSLNVIIGCPIHGDFNQTPAMHLVGHGCQICGGSYVSNTDTFIKKASAIHNNQFDYSKSDYVRNSDDIIIICMIHGEFKQTPANHLKGQGCAKCSRKLMSERMSSTTDEFIIKATSKHGGKYDYSKVDYKNNTDKIIIVCPKHGEFKQIPANHLYGNGCPKCAQIGFSKISIEWMTFIESYYDISIQHMGNSSKEYMIGGNTRWKADGYCKDTNTIYEFHGDYWHGNPKVYKPSAKNTICNKTMGFLYKKTTDRESKIKSLGYNLITIWEHDWYLAVNMVRKIQKLYMNR